MSTPSFFYRASGDGRRYSVYIRGEAGAIGYVVSRGTRWQAISQFGREIGEPRRRRDQAAARLAADRDG